MLCPKDNGGFRWRRNGVRRRSAAENRQRGRWWRSRAGGRKDARRFVMRGTPRPLSVVLRGRVRALRQRPGAMAHLHGGRMICVRARHEACRYEHAARQRRQQQQGDPEVGSAALCPADIHGASLGQGEHAARPAVIRSPPVG